MKRLLYLFLFLLIASNAVAFDFPWGADRWQGAAGAATPTYDMTLAIVGDSTLTIESIGYTSSGSPYTILGLSGLVDMDVTYGGTDDTTVFTGTDSGDVTGTTPSFSIDMDADKSLTCTFSGGAYDILIKIGTYTGNGSDDRGITGIGFEPELVIIHGDGSGAGAWRSAAFTGDDSATLAAATANAANKIQAFGSDGFTIGTHADVNTNTTEYYYIAFKDNGSGKLAYGTYTGDDTSSRNITGFGFSPDFAAVKSESTSMLVYTTSLMPADTCLGWFTDVGQSTNRIKSLISDGVEIGNSAIVNSTGVEYYYFAFEDTANKIATITYEGDGTASHSITGVGFQPEWMSTKEIPSSAGYFKTDDMVTNWAVQGAGSGGASRIISIDSDGFTLGSSGGTNENLIDYYPVLFKE